MNNSDDPHAPTPEPRGQLDILYENGYTTRFLDAMPVLRRAYDLLMRGLAADSHEFAQLTLTHGPALVRLDHVTAVVLRED